VHKLKPTLGMVGLSDLQKKIISLESEIKQGINQDKYDATWTKILQNLDQVVPVLQNELYKLRK
jgi:HPt (histidine-containing phosphotransfer) domain-containing protein